MSAEKIAAVGTNIAQKTTMIWNVPDMLRGPFKPHEYGIVILPMTRYFYKYSFPLLRVMPQIGAAHLP